MALPPLSRRRRITEPEIPAPPPRGTASSYDTTAGRLGRPVSVEADTLVVDGPLAGVLEYAGDPLVSSDIVGNPASSIFDSLLPRVDGRHIKIVARYDKEWGFSHRIIDTLDLLAAD